MNPENQPNWENQARKVEVEIDPMPAPQYSKTGTPTDSPSLRLQVRNWFETLPQGGKATVLIVGLLVALSLLKTLVQLVAALASLAIVGILLFAAYKFLIAPQSSQS